MKEQEKKSIPGFGCVLSTSSVRLFMRARVKYSLLCWSSFRLRSGSKLARLLRLGSIMFNFLFSPSLLSLSLYWTFWYTFVFPFVGSRLATKELRHGHSKAANNNTRHKQHFKSVSVFVLLRCSLLPQAHLTIVLHHHMGDCFQGFTLFFNSSAFSLPCTILGPLLRCCAHNKVSSLMRW